MTDCCGFSWLETESLGSGKMIWHQIIGIGISGGP